MTGSPDHIDRSGARIPPRRRRRLAPIVVCNGGVKACSRSPIPIDERSGRALPKQFANGFALLRPILLDPLRCSSTTRAVPEHRSHACAAAPEIQRRSPRSAPADRRTRSWRRRCAAISRHRQRQIGASSTARPPRQRIVEEPQRQPARPPRTRRRRSACRRSARPAARARRQTRYRRPQPTLRKRRNCRSPSIEARRRGGQRADRGPPARARRLGTVPRYTCVAARTSPLR